MSTQQQRLELWVLSQQVARVLAELLADPLLAFDTEPASPSPPDRAARVRR